MFQEKLVNTLLWSTIPILGAMLADYTITIRILRAYQSYTPMITLCVAIIVTVPTTYALVSSRINLRRMRDDLATARDAAVNANLSKTLFFANMSHELRTPLNAILGFSELLGLELFAERRAEYAKLIHSSGAHLLDLVNDLLDLSRIEAGKLELHDETLDLESMIEECVKVIAPRAREADLRLIRKVDRNIPLVNADRRALKQILLNLLTNAVKFSRADGTVEVFAATASSGEIAFGVKDEGIGIAPEDQARVLERFGQAKHEVSNTQEGTGLGLPIVKGLVESHGGRIELQSAVGKGTTVTVWLPAYRLIVPMQSAVAS